MSNTPKISALIDFGQQPIEAWKHEWTVDIPAVPQKGDLLEFQSSERGNYVIRVKRIQYIFMGIDKTFHNIIVYGKRV